jgi:hypothetical protein
MTVDRSTAADGCSIGLEVPTKEVSMADAAVFVGWGAPIPGRETRGLEVFNEALAFHGRLQDSGDVESVDVVLLAPHGGDLSGFILLRGSEDQMAALRANEEFQRINARASLVVQRLGVVDAVVGEGIGEQISIYQEAIGAVA